MREKVLYVYMRYMKIKTLYKILFLETYDIRGGDMRRYIEDMKSIREKERWIYERYMVI